MKKIVFQSVHFKASPELEIFIREKVSKLFEQDKSIMKAEITLFEGASGNYRNKFCEIHLYIPGENRFVNKNSEAYEKSILAAVHSLQKVLRRNKTKHIILRRKSKDNELLHFY